MKRSKFLCALCFGMILVLACFHSGCGRDDVGSADAAMKPGKITAKPSDAAMKPGEVTAKPLDAAVLDDLLKSLDNLDRLSGDLDDIREESLVIPQP